MAPGRGLIEQYRASFRQVPKRIILDVDDTFACMASQPARMLLTTRKLLRDKLQDIENELRGTLRNFGLKVAAVSPDASKPGSRSRWPGSGLWR